MSWHDPMAIPESPPADGKAPWEGTTPASGKRLARRALPWLGAFALLALIVWGLWPKPVVLAVEEQRTVTAWRFSGRWWSLPLPVRPPIGCEQERESGDEYLRAHDRAS